MFYHEGSKILFECDVNKRGSVHRNVRLRKSYKGWAIESKFDLFLSSPVSVDFPNGGLGLHTG